MVINSFICPSEVKPNPKLTATGRYGVANYNWNVGDWHVFSGVGATTLGRGAFGANRSRRLAEFTDGLSYTVMSSEVKTYQSVLTKCTLSTVQEPVSIPSPAASIAASLLTST